MTEQANLQHIIAKCWADDAFKQRLLSDPAGTLAAEGMAVPEGVTVRVVENTAQEVTVVLPPRPTDLTEDALHGAYGGRGEDTCYYKKYQGHWLEFD